MAFKTFVAGDVLTAAEVNTYLMKQAVIVCTSGTRPSSPVEGMIIYETDTDDIFFYNGSSWCRLHPTINIFTGGNGVTTSAAAEALLATIAIPSQGFPYRARIVAQVFKTQTVASDSIALTIRQGGGVLAVARGQSAAETLVCQSFADSAGGGATTLTIHLSRASGTGTASTFADGSSNFSITTIEAL